jgi:hypothetical protein
MSSSVTNQGAAQAQIEAGKSRAFAIGGAGLIIFAIIAFVAGRSASDAMLPFLHDYLIAYVFVAAISVGSLAVLMIHHMTGGWWGYPLRRILEANVRTLPLIAVLFLPVVFFMGHIYAQWVSPDPNDASLAMKAWYLNTHGFIIRAVVYFAIWLFLAFRLTGMSAREDATGDPSLSHKMEATSAPGLVIGAATVTVATVDWVMSLQPHWYSTIWGFLFIVIFIITGYSFSVITFSRLAVNEPLGNALDPSRYLDVGNLLLAFTILWAYLSFSQFLIIWAANLKDEIPFYMTRASGGWGVIGGLLLL